MLVSERSPESEAWLSQIDGMVTGMDRVDQIRLRHTAYRAAAIAFIKSFPIYAMGPHRDERRRRDRTYRIGERFDTKPARIQGYSAEECTVGVGMARDTRITVPSFFRRSHEPVVTREEFYIRDFRRFTNGSDPDISVEGWSIPRGDVRLPSAAAAAKDIHAKDVHLFGREISRLAVAADVELPGTIEEIYTANLAEVPRS